MIERGVGIERDKFIEIERERDRNMIKVNKS